MSATEGRGKVAVEHDPLVCGLGLATEYCPGCLANPHPRETPIGPYDLAQERWEQLQEEYPRLLRGKGPDGWRRPKPLDDELFRQLITTLLCPERKQILKELLLDSTGLGIGEDIIETSLAIAQEIARD
jgi:hypothetical protein